MSETGALTEDAAGAEERSSAASSSIGLALPPPASTGGGWRSVGEALAPMSMPTGS